MPRNATMEVHDPLYDHFHVDWRLLQTYLYKFTDKVPTETIEGALAHEKVIDLVDNFVFEMNAITRSIIQGEQPEQPRRVEIPELPQCVVTGCTNKAQSFNSEFTGNVCYQCEMRSYQPDAEERKWIRYTDNIQRNMRTIGVPRRRSNRMRASNHPYSKK